jgi:PHD/YefM family antitoxin component YafN of YafNO toxin-antitoxin module
MTIEPSDTYSLTEFERDSMRILEKLDTSGRAAVLTVESKAKAVILSVEAFERLSASAERAETVQILRARLEEIDRGHCRPMLEVLEELRQELGIDAKPDEVA